jgi:hypothetical protein
MTPCYYSASNAQAFQDAIAKIIDQVVGGEFGNVMCDDSCYGTGCPAGQVCARSELNPVAQCVPDPCMGARCSAGQFCRLGMCVNACTNGCNQGSKCQNGQCVKDPCAGIMCTTGMACNPSTGACGDDLCAGVTCAMKAACDPATGKCIDDQCYIEGPCPMGTACVHPTGECSAPTTGGHGRGGGCTVGERAAGRSLALAWAALLACALLRRRR